MILVKTTRYGEVTEIMNSDNYIEIVDKIEELTEELESNGIFCINTIAYKTDGRIDEFASVENGWECGFIMASGWIDPNSLK